MTDEQKKLNISAAIASVSVALTLVVLKIWAFAATGSLSIAATLADSAMDTMVSLAAMAAIFYATKPADEDHAFGHTAVEDLASLGQAVFVTISAGVIGIAALQRLLSPSEAHIQDEGPGILVMAISIFLTLALVVWQGRVAAKTKNKVVAADRLHYLGDLLPNVGAMVSLWASRQFGLTIIDSIVALAAAVIMAFGAFRIGKGAWDALMDRQADPEVIEGIETLIKAWPGILGYHDVKTRISGSRVFIQIHIELDGNQSLHEAHEISAGLRRTILLAYPQADVIIHKDVFQNRPKA